VASPIKASAPGKLVLSGEYAVLAGAPALVAAVDRRVTCTLTPRSAGGWRFVGRGFAQDIRVSKGEVFAAPPTTTPGVARQAIAEADAPEHLEVEIDSSACYRDGVKLGIGSSAAVVTALATALAALDGRAPRLADLYTIHADFQGGGSGLDIAAAVTGGVIRFEERVVTPVRLDSSVSLTFVFTGTGTRTADLLDRFAAWRRDTTPPALERLAAAAREVADCAADADNFLYALDEYADVLERFDRSARIGIFGAGHLRARAIAAACGVVYKPCGAGGGDTGVAAAIGPGSLRDFERRAADDGLTVLSLVISATGVEVRTPDR